MSCCKGPRLPRWLLDRPPLLRTDVVARRADRKTRSYCRHAAAKVALVFKLDGELGTVSDVLHGNSLSDRCSGHLGHGKSVDLWVEHVQPLREYPAPSPIVTPPWTRNATRILTLASERYYHWLVTCTARGFWTTRAMPSTCAPRRGDAAISKAAGHALHPCDHLSTMGTSSKFNGATLEGLVQDRRAPQARMPMEHAAITARGFTAPLPRRGHYAATRSAPVDTRRLRSGIYRRFGCGQRHLCAAQHWILPRRQQ